MIVNNEIHAARDTDTELEEEEGNSKDRKRKVARNKQSK